MTFSKLSRRLPKSLRPSRRPVRTALSLQPLEAREVPAAVHVWTGANSNYGTLTVDTAVGGNQDLRLYQGGGVLELKKPNTYAGDTIVDTGILRLSGAAGANNVLPATHLYVGNNTGPAGEAVVQVNADGQLPVLPIAVGSDGVLNLLGHTDFVGDVSLSGGPIATGGGTLGLGSNLIVTGDALLNVDGATKAGAVVLPAGDHTIDVAANKTPTVKTRLTGDGGVALTNSGTVAYQNEGPAANDYTGQTWVKDGTLLLDDNGSDEAVSAATVEVGDGTGTPGSAVLRLNQSAEIPNAAAVLVHGDGLFDLKAPTGPTTRR